MNAVDWIGSKGILWLILAYYAYFSLDKEKVKMETSIKNRFLSIMKKNM